MEETPPLRSHDVIRARTTVVVKSGRQRGRHLECKGCGLIKHVPEDNKTPYCEKCRRAQKEK